MKVLKNPSIILIVLFIYLSSCGTFKIDSFQSENIQLGDNVSMVNFSEINLPEYKDTLDKEMDEVLNYAVTNMQVGCPEGLLGNFICDLSMFMANKYYATKIKPDFCVLNNGGFRTSLNKGPITKGKIFEIMPFDNYLVVVTLNDKQLNELLDYIKKKSQVGASRKSGVPVSGIRMRITDNEIDKCFIQNVKYNPSKNYNILTTDYLANGGDNMTFFKKASNYINTEVLLRDVIIDYIREINKIGTKVEAKFDGRIEINQ